MSERYLTIIIGDASTPTNESNPAGSGIDVTGNSGFGIYMRSVGMELTLNSSAGYIFV